MKKIMVKVNSKLKVMFWRIKSTAKVAVLSFQSGYYKALSERTMSVEYLRKYIRAETALMALRVGMMNPIQF